jgi:nitrite reductase/ring-hydroxylating ferredoxin subunit
MSQWYSVIKTSDLKPGQGKQIPLEGKILALFNVDGQFFAIDDTCTHAGASLAEGAVADSVVTCPWHGATFDIKTGAVLSDPAYEGVASYKVKVEGDDVLIEL